ncbi:hypothetical protein D0S45_17875 [Marinifilum sp. JC120]|nr:hypothetical protein D0S45_17875 [Marinifilum sp. JC120]
MSPSVNTLFIRLMSLQLHLRADAGCLQANGSDLCQSMTSVMQNDPHTCEQKYFVHPACGLQVRRPDGTFYIYIAAL